jgi:hypothetical protein
MLTVRSEIGPYRRPTQRYITMGGMASAFAKAEPVPPLFGDAGRLASLKKWGFRQEPVPIYYIPCQIFYVQY